MKRNFKRVLISLYAIFACTQISSAHDDHPYPNVNALKQHFEAEAKRQQQEKKSYEIWRQDHHGQLPQEEVSLKDLEHEFELPKAEGIVKPSLEFLDQIGVEIRNLTDEIIKEKFSHLPKLEEEILSFSQQKDQFIEGFAALGYDGERKYQTNLKLLETQKASISKQLESELSKRKIIQHLILMLKEQKQTEMLPLLIPALDTLGF